MKTRKVVIKTLIEEDGEISANKDGDDDGTDVGRASPIILPIMRKRVPDSASLETSSSDSDCPIEIVSIVGSCQTEQQRNAELQKQLSVGYEFHSILKTRF